MKRLGLLVLTLFIAIAGVAWIRPPTPAGVLAPADPVQVMINGDAHRSCRTTLKDVAGAVVVTIEGLAGDGGKLHPLQQAFIDHGAFQCGYCTSGMIIDAHALLQETPHPSREAIVARMDHNLCRCGAHTRIVDAIEQAAKPGAGS